MITLNKTLSILIIGMAISFSLGAQENKAYSVPNVDVESIDGGYVSAATINNGEYPFMICFWKSCCNSTLKFMEALAEIYPDLENEYSFKVFAISVDDTRSSFKVKPLVNGNGWEFEFYLDPNENLKRAMNVNLTPHYFIFDQNKKLIWQNTGYLQGDEFEIQRLLEKLARN